MDGSIDLDTDTIKIALLADTYTPNIDTNDFWDDISANEVANSGTYAQDGATLSVTLSQDNTDDEGVFDAADVSWTGTTITARYAVIYKYTGTEATSPLICVIDFGSNIISTGGTFAIVFSSEGIINLN